VTSDFNNLCAEISAHPWRSVMIAFAAGGCIALTGSRRPAVRAVATTLTAAMLDVAGKRAKRLMGSWIGAREHAP